MTEETDTMDMIMDMPRTVGTPRDERLAMPRAALFDLDGTLIDSVPDITAAVAELLAAEQLPPLSQDQVRAMVGRGLKVLVRKVYDAQGMALDEASLECRLDDMREVYARHLVGKTTLMPGVKTALEFFRSQDCAMAVVTNKLVGATETILGHFGLSDYFDVVIGDSTAPPLSLLARKPQPDMLLEALRRLGVTADDAVMVGDSGVDVRAGRAAGMRVVGVRGGYSSEPLESFAPDRLVASLAEMPAIFKA
jgi:phosphoglycolate phosphatase